MAKKNLRRHRAPVKPRSAKRKSSAHSHAASKTGPRIPAAIEVAIDHQRDSVGIAISLSYCLHSALLREINEGGKVESEGVDGASEWADLSDISAMLLVRLNAVRSALDPVSLRRADVDPEMVRLIEEVRGLGIVGGDTGGAS